MASLSHLTIKHPLLFVIGSAEIGGAEKQLIRLAQELQARGVNVEVVFTQTGGPLTTELDQSMIPWRVFPIRLRHNRVKSFGSAIWLCIYLAKRRPTLVNAWLPESAVIALPLVRFLLPGHPRVVSVRGSLLPSNRLVRHLYRRVLRHSDRVLINAEYLFEMAVRNHGITAKKVETILNGVSIPNVGSFVSKQPPTAVVVANFHSHKGHMILLEALAKVSAPTKVRLCGTGNAKVDIERAIISLGLESTVKIVDAPADVSMELQLAQFAIHPSLTEGLSNAILEELASGLPVIAFDIAGNLRVVSHGVNGLLVETGDVAQLGAAIELLATDVALRNKLSDGARKRAQEYSWESCVAKYEKIYKEIILKT